MKNIIILFAFSLLLAAACRKDKTDPFVTASPNFTEIKALDAQMSSNAITVFGSGAQLISNGTVIVYKTNAGNYGKLKLISATGEPSFNMVVDVLTFDAAGKVLLSKKSITVSSGKMLDLNTGIVYDSGPKDFQCKMTINFDLDLQPQGTAKFKKY